MNTRQVKTTLKAHLTDKRELLRNHFGFCPSAMKKMTIKRQLESRCTTKKQPPLISSQRRLLSLEEQLANQRVANSVS